MIPDILPLLNGWSYSVYAIDIPTIIPRGTEKIIYRLEGSGWIVAGLCTVDDPNAELVLEAKDPYKGYLGIYTTPLFLKETGLDIPNGAVFCSKYDDVNNLYTVNIVPSSWLPFVGEYTFKVAAPMTRDIKVYNYAHFIITIENREKFISSLKEVIM